MAIAAGAVEGLAVIDADFWRGRRVLITGHTGFKGSWLAIWLSRLGAQVSGVALPPSTTPSLFDLARIRELVDGHVCDIRDAVRLRAVVRNADPEVVFHLAAQPLVRASYREPVTTFSTCGISGATQHMAGCKGAKRILAINSDAQAPIMLSADYAVVGDLKEIVPAISAEIRKQR